VFESLRVGNTFVKRGKNKYRWHFQKVLTTHAKDLGIYGPFLIFKHAGNFPTLGYCIAGPSAWSPLSPAPSSLLHSFILAHWDWNPSKKTKSLYNQYSEESPPKYSKILCPGHDQNSIN
jgi:hypothetical protein